MCLATVGHYGQTLHDPLGSFILVSSVCFPLAFRCIPISLKTPCLMFLLIMQNVMCMSCRGVLRENPHRHRPFLLFLLLLLLVSLLRRRPVLDGIGNHVHQLRLTSQKVELVVP